MIKFFSFPFSSYFFPFFAVPREKYHCISTADTWFSRWNLFALKIENVAYSTLPPSFSRIWEFSSRWIERYRWSSGNGIFAGDRKQEVDRFGYYQMIMFAIISLPLFLSAGFTLAYVFTAGEVKYRYVTTDATCDSTGDIYFFFSFIFSLYFRIIYHVYPHLFWIVNRISQGRQPFMDE